MLCSHTVKTQIILYYTFKQLRCVELRTVNNVAESVQLEHPSLAKTHFLRTPRSQPERSGLSFSAYA